MSCLKQIFKSASLTTLLIALALPASVFASSERVRISQQQLSLEITETLKEYRKHKTMGELQKFISSRVNANAMKEIERRIGNNKSLRAPAATQEGDTIVFVNTEVPVTLRIVDPDKHVVEINHSQVTLTEDFVKDMRNLEAALPKKHSSLFNFHLLSEAQAQEPISTTILVTIMAVVFAVRVAAEIWSHFHTQHNVDAVAAPCSQLEGIKQKLDTKTCDPLWDIYAKVDDAIPFCLGSATRSRDAWTGFGCSRTENLERCKATILKLCSETPVTNGAPNTQQGR